MDGRSQRRKRRAAPRMVEVKQENEEGCTTDGRSQTRKRRAVPWMVEVKEENEGPHHGW